jgi:hypothetical protein
LSIGAWLALAVFLLFFGLICPIFLYWFNHFLKKAFTNRVISIGFSPEKRPRD